MPSACGFKFLLFLSDRGGGGINNREKTHNNVLKNADRIRLRVKAADHYLCEGRGWRTCSRKV